MNIAIIATIIIICLMKFCMKWARNDADILSNIIFCSPAHPIYLGIFFNDVCVRVCLIEVLLAWHLFTPSQHQNGDIYLLLPCYGKYRYYHAMATFTCYYHAMATFTCLTCYGDIYLLLPCYGDIYLLLPCYVTFTWYYGLFLGHKMKYTWCTLVQAIFLCQKWINLSEPFEV